MLCLLRHFAANLRLMSPMSVFTLPQVPLRVMCSALQLTPTVKPLQAPLVVAFSVPRRCFAVRMALPNADDVVSEADKWIVGWNTPAIRRGTGGELTPQAQQILANVLWHCERHVGGLATALSVTPDPVAVAARLTAVNVKTLRGCRWHGQGHRGATGAVAVPAALVAPAAPAASAAPATSSLPPSAARTASVSSAMLPAVSAIVASSPAAVASAAPSVHIGRPLPAADTDEDMDALDAWLDAPPDRLPGQPLLDTWSRHPNYRLGVRHAELATMWITHAMPEYLFPGFLAWAR